MRFEVCHRGNRRLFSSYLDACNALGLVLKDDVAFDEIVISKDSEGYYVYGLLALNGKVHYLIDEETPS